MRPARSRVGNVLRSAAPENCAAFFERVGQGFDRAALESQDAIAPRDYDLGGFRVRLCFAGGALIERLTAAFEHLRLDVATAGAPDLCIGIWDSATTNIHLAPPPWKGDDVLPRGGVAGYGAPPVMAHYAAESRMLSVLHAEKRQGYFWIQDAAQLPLYQCGSPLLALLHLWFSQHERTLVHGGAVGTRDGGVLLVGKGGSGKSTATLCCLDSPLFYAADDYGVVSANDAATSPAFYFHSLYSSGKVNAPDRERHPLIARARCAGVLDNQKSLHFLYPPLAERLIRGFALRAIIMPRVTGARDTRIVPASAAQALLALAPSTLFQLPGAESAKFRRMSRIAKSLPAYTLESGTDWTQIPRALQELIATLNARALA